MPVRILRLKYILFIITLVMILLLVVYAFRDKTTEIIEGDELFSIICSQGENKQQIKGFYSEEVLYFCIPGYMKMDEILLKSKTPGELTIGNQIFTNGNTLTEIEENKLYDASYDRKGKEKEIFRIMFMKGAHLPVVQLTTASGNMDYIHSNKGNSESGFMKITDSDGKLKTVTEVKSIAGRGNTSWDAAKKSYVVRLQDATDILGMGSEKVWVLNANYYDGAYIRNQIGFEIAKKGGISYVPDACFVDLYVNNEYMGLFQITEKIKTGSNRIDINDNYLLEIDYPERAIEEQDYIQLPNEQPIVIHSPEKNRDVERVQQFFDGFSEQMEQGNIPFEKIDLLSFAKMFVMEDILQDMDFGYSSHYMILNLEKEILSECTIWDLDNTMGRGIVEEPEKLFVTNYDLYCNNLSRWYAVLYSDENFREQAALEYQKNFRPALANLINGGIKENIDVIKASIDMDLRRFPETRSRIMSDASLEENVEYLTNYLKTKMEIMDDCFTGEFSNEYMEVKLPSIQSQESNFEIILNNQEENAGFFMQYRMLFMLLVMFLICMILWYRCKKAGK